MANLLTPAAIAIDRNNGLLIAERDNGKVRRVDLRTGIITTVAGGFVGFAGDGSQARSAAFTGLSGIRFDAAGNLFIGDLNNHRIRAIRGPIP